ncbi:hypothetical protein BBH99_10390 [Chryseobacterium contaminans]|uniref:Uncharacterized protein n=1 Tax=Chryseobacterium contaminans TaxID=1423959 RepID=A0A1M7GY31_9FLAO|nr:hypothetical protein [Chryseobacterium contaminans]OCA77932.1 hypothetical protein BBH99_10390 [Chryseobacterium contaminans]SHM21023.1 hypothetical protein SAMN05444407_1114 [Chryseobacterium contaminans]
MAIILENTSRCPLCNNILDDTKEYILTPPLISNELDKLFKLSDSGIHLDCLNKSHLNNLLFKYLELNRQYSITMRALMLKNNPKDIIGFNLLSSDEIEPINKYNYFIILKQDISKWTDFEYFNYVANDFLNKNKWKGVSQFNYLKNLLETINS